MNLTILSLLASSLQTSPFITSNSINRISVSNSQFTRFSTTILYNIKNMNIHQVKFSLFQGTPIYYEKSDIEFIYYQLSYRNIANTTLKITSTMFYRCISQNSGGGLYYLNENGLIEIANSIFRECVSYMQGGGCFCKCSEISINSIIFNLCNGVTYQAGYLETSYYNEISYVLVNSCFVNDVVNYMGPVLEFNNDFKDSFFSPTISNVNASYNVIRTDYQCGLISIKCVGFDVFASYYMYYFTVFENVCPSEIEFYGTDFIMAFAYYFNMIQNHISNSVFIISGDINVFATECFIGHDYGVFYYLKQTPFPTESPMETLIPPTPPPLQNFTNDESENLVKHYEYVYNKVKQKFEKNLDKNEQEKADTQKIKNVENSFSNHYDNNRKYARSNRRMMIDGESEIVLAIFPDNSGNILFDQSKIDYPEIDGVDCEDQCYISDFETYPIEEQTLNELNIQIGEETSASINEIQLKFPTNAKNIVIICVIILVTLLIYAMVMNVIFSRLRLRNESDDENESM